MVGTGRVESVSPTKVGKTMETVLGLSVTSSSVGWVLLDGPGVDAATLDHDVFDVPGGSVDDGDICKHVAAVRGVQAIAAASGHELKSIGLTWTVDAAATANLLLTSLPDLGVEKVVSVRPAEATRTWAHVFGGALGFEKAAVCVVEPSSATVLSFGYGAVRTFATQARESDEGLGRWLKDIFETHLLEPEHVFLIGSRTDIEPISGRLSEALGISVVTSNEAQLVLARGAALAARSNPQTAAIPVRHEQPDGVTPRPTVATALAQKAGWFSPPARAAAVLVAGVVALFVLGPELVGQPESPPMENQPVANSSETSVSIQMVPAPAAAPPAKKVIQRVVQPAPAPPPPSAPQRAQENMSTVASSDQEAAPSDVAEPEPDVAEPELPVAALPVEVAHLPAQSEVAHLPAQAVGVPTGTPHLPAEAAPHLPGAAPMLAAEAPAPASAPEPAPPMQVESNPVWAALP
jgi:hypothetical protein